MCALTVRTALKEQKPSIIPLQIKFAGATTLGYLDPREHNKFFCEPVNPDDYDDTDISF